MEDVTLYTAATVTVIGSLTGAVVTIINAVSSARDRHQANVARAELIAKADTSAQKQTEIHDLVDGNMTDMKKQLAESRAETANLRELVTSLKVAFVPMKRK